MGMCGSSKTESTQTMEPWGPMQPHLQNVMGGAGSLWSQGGPQYYPGQTFAGRDPLSDQAQNMRLNYATNSMPGQIYDAQRAQSFALNSPDAANNPYVQNMMQSNQFMANRNLQENLLPAIQSGAVASGQMGGSRQGIAQGLAARGTQEALANANASTMMDAYGKGLGAQQGALSMAPNMMAMGMAPMDVMSQTGAYNQAIDSQALTEDMKRWGFNQERPWDALGRYSAALSPGAQYGKTTGQQDAGGAGLLGTALGLGAMAMPFIAPAAAPAMAGLSAATGAMSSSGAGAAAPMAGGYNPFLYSF